MLTQTRDRQRYSNINPLKIENSEFPFPITSWDRYFTPLGIESINLQQLIMQRTAR